MKFEHEWIQNTLDSIDTEGTRIAYNKGFVRFWKWYSGEGEPDLTIHVINRFKRFLQNKGYAASTIAIDLCSIKLALHVNARPNDCGDRLDLQDIRQLATIKKVKSDSNAVPLSIEERDKVLAACPPTLIGIRDLAVLTVLFYVGLRRGEVEKLDLKDYDQVHNQFVIREAKHHKTRKLPLHPLVVERINAWLEIREALATCEALFVNVHQKKTTGKRLRGGNIYWILSNYCEEAGIAHYHPHDCRSTHITLLHDNGIPVGDIQTLAGHSNAGTTIAYVKVNMNNLRKAVLTL